jgi:CheY-like chemotaxis protein
MGTIKILIVDDSKVNLNMVRQGIMGHINDCRKEVALEVYTAQNCHDALNLYDEHKPFDLILLDFDLNQANCLEEWTCCTNKDKNEKTVYFGKKHGDHNGVELAKLIFDKGYRGRFGLNTSLHVADANFTDKDEQRLIDIFLGDLANDNKKYTDFKIQYVGKSDSVKRGKDCPENNLNLPPVFKMIDEIVKEKAPSGDGGGKSRRKRKHKRKTQRKRKYRRKTQHK